MRILLFIVIALFCSGCAGSYRLVESDDRFSTDGTRTVQAMGCRVSSSSIAGGIYFDNNGVYFNPWIKKQTKTDEIVASGFMIENLHEASSNYGTANALGLISSVIWNVDGEAIPLQLQSQESTRDNGPAYYNSVDRSTTIGMQDRAVATLSLEKFKKLITAKEIAVQIIGSRGSVTYENKQIASSFRRNLLQFGNDALGMQNELPKIEAVRGVKK